MNFFVDANAILYSVSEGTARESCLKILSAIATGVADGRTSPVVLEEVWYVAAREYPGKRNGIVHAALEIFSPLLPVTEEALVHALSLPDSQLGPNDRLHLGTCAVNEIDTVLTADRAFEGIDGIHRVDPFDAGAVDELLAGAA